MPTAEVIARNAALVQTIVAARADIARCMADGLQKGLDPSDALFIVGAPRMVARICVDAEVCDCPVLAVGVSRKGFIEAVRAMGREALAVDIEKPLVAGHVRAMVLITGGTAVVDIVAPTPDFDTDHTHGGRPS